MMKKKNSKRSSCVRKYHKSEFPRLRWTPELHQHFTEAVQILGGKHKATPKRILQKMRVKGLRIAHIKSHLQMYRNMKGHAILAPVDHLLEGNAPVNDPNICSFRSTQRSVGTTLKASEYEGRIVNQELQLLDNRGLSQSSENQEPESSTCLLSVGSNEEENTRIVKFPDLSFSFSTSLIPVMHGGCDQMMMRFSSKNAAANHAVHSSSIQSFGSTCINLDLTI